MTPDTLTVDGTTYIRAYPVAPDKCPHCGAGPRAWTPAQIIRALREHDAPKSEAWLRPGPGHPAFSTVRRVFGSWNNALVAAGYDRRPFGQPTYWTRERILDAFALWAREHHGRPPSDKEWQTATVLHPASMQVRQRFGSWNAALDAAGFFPRASWGHRLAPKRRQSRKRARELGSSVA